MSNIITSVSKRDYSNKIITSTEIEHYLDKEYNVFDPHLHTSISHDVIPHISTLPMPCSCNGRVRFEGRIKSKLDIIL